MAAVSGKPFSVLLIISVAFTAATLATTAKAQALMPPILPFLPTPGGGSGPVPWQPGEEQKCWSSLTSIQGCIMEIYTSYFSGQIGVIGHACCQAITEVSEGCWPKMFPFNPFFAPLLKTSCSASPPSPTMNINNVKKVHVRPGLLSSLLLPGGGGGGGGGNQECWSALDNTKGCLLEIYRSLPGGGRMDGSAIGPDCCKAITTMKDDCWQKLFPTLPSLSPLLKDSCLRINGPSAAEAPK